MVDADGVVHYSDQASPGAEKIFTSSSPPRGRIFAARAGRFQPTRAAPGTDWVTPIFHRVAVSDQTFFGDDVIAVHLSLAPALKPNQNITWHLNGKQLDYRRMPGVFSAAFDRGTYALARPSRSAHGESQTSNSVSFFVRQPPRWRRSTSSSLPVVCRCSACR